MTIERRTFLSLVGAGTGALALAGCHDAGRRPERGGDHHREFFAAIQSSRPGRMGMDKRLIGAGG